jgi:hypothetical protein
MAEETKPQQRRVMPQNELDFYLLTTNSQWGQSEIKDRLDKKDDDDNDSDYWNLLAFYSRDLRLANLSVWDNELNYVRYFLDLSKDLLHVGLKKNFSTSLGLAATVLETSQSKGGFLRRRMGTITSEYKEELEPPKRSLFGMSNKGEK